MSDDQHCFNLNNFVKKIIYSQFGLSLTFRQTNISLCLRERESRTIMLSVDSILSQFPHFLNTVIICFDIRKEAIVYLNVAKSVRVFRQTTRHNSHMTTHWSTVFSVPNNYLHMSCPYALVISTWSFAKIHRSNAVNTCCS